MNEYLKISFKGGIFNLPGFKKDENKTNLFQPFSLCSIESIKGSSPLSLEWKRSGVGSKLNISGGVESIPTIASVTWRVFVG